MWESVLLWEEYQLPETLNQYSIMGYKQILDYYYLFYFFRGRIYEGRGGGEVIRNESEL